MLNSAICYIVTVVYDLLQETVALSAEVGEDLEQVEGVQRKFDDFQKVCRFYKQAAVQNFYLAFVCSRTLQSYAFVFSSSFNFATVILEMHQYSPCSCGYILH